MTMCALESSPQDAYGFGHKTRAGVFSLSLSLTRTHVCIRRAGGNVRAVVADSHPRVVVVLVLVQQRRAWRAKIARRLCRSAKAGTTFHTSDPL